MFSIIQSLTDQCGVFRARHNFNELRRPKKLHCPILSALSNIFETSKVVISSCGATVGSVVTQVGLLIGQRSWIFFRKGSILMRLGNPLNASVAQYYLVRQIQKGIFSLLTAHRDLLAYLVRRLLV